MISHRFSAFFIHAIAWTAITIGLIVSSNTFYIVLLHQSLFIDMWFALCLGFMLRLPTIRKDVEAPAGWEWESIDVQGYPVRWLKREWNPEQTPCHIYSRMEFSRSEYVGKKCVVSGVRIQLRLV